MESREEKACQGTTRKSRAKRSKSQAVCCAEQASGVWMVWLGRGEDKESEKGSGLFPGPGGRRGFSEAGFGLVF